MYTKSFRDIQLPPLGLGSLHLPAVAENPDCIDRAAAQHVIDLAIERGINYIDTAYTYHGGDSEKFLGEALSRYPRDRYYLTSKYYAAAGIDVEKMFEEQLRRCRTDYFDFYLLHGMDENYIDAYMDPQKDVLGYLRRQKERGRIRYLGFSSHGAPETLRRFLDWYDDFDMALIQLNYVDWTLLEGKAQYDILTDRQIPIWVMEPLKGGRLMNLSKEAWAILQEAAPGQSPSSWAFRFLMGLPNVQMVLSGMSSAAQVVENADIFERQEPLSRHEALALEQAAEVFFKDLGVPCSACRYCCASCPAELDIPLLIKGYNELRVSGETWRVAGLSQSKGPAQCLDCGTCLKHCPQKIEIPQVMKQFAALQGKQGLS